PAYMAPEQFLRRPTDARADQFSFCVALYEALWSCRPFGGNSTSDLMANVVAGKVREPPADAKVPTWVRRVVLRGLQRDPAARHPSMQALLDALGKDPARTRKRWLAVAGIAAATGAVSAAGSVALHARVGMCTSGAERLAGGWE